MEMIIDLYITICVIVITIRMCYRECTETQRLRVAVLEHLSTPALLKHIIFIFYDFMSFGRGTSNALYTLKPEGSVQLNRRRWANTWKSIVKAVML